MRWLCNLQQSFPHITNTYNYIIWIEQPQTVLFNGVEFYKKPNVVNYERHQYTDSIKWLSQFELMYTNRNYCWTTIYKIYADGGVVGVAAATIYLLWYYGGKLLS